MWGRYWMDVLGGVGVWGVKGVWGVSGGIRVQPIRHWCFVYLFTRFPSFTILVTLFRPPSDSREINCNT